MTSIEDGRVYVHFIDFGNDLDFKLTSLRKKVIFTMPPCLSEYPAMSRRFHIFNIPHKEGSDEDQVKTYKLLDRKLFRFQIEEMTPEGEPVVTLSTKEERYFNSSMKCFLFPAARSNLNRAKDLRHINLAAGDHVGIVHKIVGGNELFVYLKEDAPCPQDICLRLHDIFDGKQSSYVASVNEIVIVRVGDMFHRGIARRVGSRKVECELFDIVQDVTVDTSDVFPLINFVEDYPCLAIRCKVSDESHMRYFQKKCQKRKEAAFRVTSKQNYSFVIEPIQTETDLLNCED